jgi:hypothetical protein
MRDTGKFAKFGAFASAADKEPLDKIYMARSWVVGYR